MKGVKINKILETLPKKVSKLREITTLEELENHVGKVLVFGHSFDFKNIIPTIWMGVLEHNPYTHIPYFPNKRTRIRYLDIYTSNFLFLTSYNKILNILNPTHEHIFEYQGDDIRCSYAQERIFIPNKELITYYSVCRGHFECCRKNK